MRQIRRLGLAGLFVAMIFGMGPRFVTASGPGVGTGTISGTVTFEGAAPMAKRIDMSSEPGCAQQYGNPPVTDVATVGPGNTLDGVLVYISAGAPDDPAPKNAVTFAQKGCRFVPHVAPLLVNQEVKITNEDQTTHNIHPQPKLNREWNRSLPPGAPPITDSYQQAEIIPVKCNVHPWMHGYLVVLKNSHYAFTENKGSFALPNLPPGKYTVTAWQEGFGEQSQEVTISGSETKAIHFVLKSKAH